MILLGALCFVLCLKLGVSTPQGNRYKEPFLQNENHNEFNIERNIGEPTTPYYVSNKQSGQISLENERNLLFHNEGYNQNNFQRNLDASPDLSYNQNPSSTFLNRQNKEGNLLNSGYRLQNPSPVFSPEEKIKGNEYLRRPVQNNFQTISKVNSQNEYNNYPGTFTNMNQQPNIIPENVQDYGHVNVERNFNNVQKDLPGVSYIDSLPTAERIQSFRSDKNENREINLPSVGDILPELNAHGNIISPNELSTRIVSKGNPTSKIINNNRRQNSRLEQFGDSMDQKYPGEVYTQLNVPVATPEYINSILNEYKPLQQSNVNPVTFSQNGRKNNYNLQPNVQNITEGTFRNPSAQILYETGKAKPYEINTQQIFNSPQENTRGGNILSNAQRLKDLYMSSKPTKRYMVVYPDGRVEQVDQLERIQKNYPNYVMLNAKELLQKDKPNPNIPTALQKTILQSNLPVTTTKKPQTNPVQERENDQIEKVLEQKIDDQPFSVTTKTIVSPSETVNVSTSEMKPNSIETKSATEDYLQEPAQEVGIHNKNPIEKLETSQENNILNNDEAKKSVPIEDLPTTESSIPGDLVTTMKSTISTIPDDTTNPNVTDSPNLSKEVTEDSNSPLDNLTAPNFDNVTAEIITPTLKNKSDETLEDNGYTEENLESSNVQHKLDLNNSPTPLELSPNIEESNTTTKSPNEIVNAYEQGTKDDESLLQPETVVSNDDNDKNSDAIGPTTEPNIVSTIEDNTTLVPSNDSALTNPLIEEDILNDNSSLQVKPSGTINLTPDSPSDNENNTENVPLQKELSASESDLDGSKNNNNVTEAQTPDDVLYDDTLLYSDNSSNTPYEVNSTPEKPESNRTSNLNPKQDVSDNIDDVKTLKNVDSDTVSENPDLSIEEIENTAGNGDSNGGGISSNDEDTIAPALISNDSYYQNPTETAVTEDNDDDDDDDDDNKEGSDTSKTSDNFQTDASQVTDKNTETEPSLFNFSEALWNKLMRNEDLHNSFYFLFPRPKPKVKDTRKTIYPNGTVVIETTETIDAGDGETTSSKTVLKYENCKLCENT